MAGKRQNIFTNIIRFQCELVELTHFDGQSGENCLALFDSIFVL